MPFPRLLRQFELPLLKRELTESAQRKRTYALRVLLLVILSLIFAVFYAEVSSRRNHVLQLLGSGRDLAFALILTDLVAIYGLLPAMACGAISSEREQQTLPLLLISKLSPMVIILEKFISRMVPMLGLLVLTVPLLAVTYMLGGLTQQDLVLMALILLTAAVQATSTAVMYSSVFATGLAAFWATWLSLAAMLLLPPLLDEFHLLPKLRWISALPGDQQSVPFSMFFLMLGHMWGTPLELSDGVLACVPVWATSAVFLVLGRWALVRIGAAPGLTNAWLFRGLRMTRDAGQFALRQVTGVLRFVRAGLQGRAVSWKTLWSGNRSSKPAAAMHHELPGNAPIAWRESRNSLLASGALHVALITPVALIQVILLETQFTSRWDREELCILVDVVVLVIGLLMMLSQCCHLFAAERERQTLDVLLTVPVSNRVLLQQKQRAAGRLMRWLMLSITVVLFIHLSCVELRDHRFTISYMRQDAIWMSGRWWSAATLMSVSVWLHAIVYLSIARWTGTLFGLIFRSPMKAMVGSIISLLVLVCVPALLCVPIMLAARVTPDNFPPFCFSSPAFIYGFTLAGELSNVFRMSWFPESEWLVVLVNLTIYGGLWWLLRWQVLRWLPRLLNRRDTVSDAIPSTEPMRPSVV